MKVFGYEIKKSEQPVEPEQADFEAQAKELLDSHANNLASISRDKEILLDTLIAKQCGEGGCLPKHYSGSNYSIEYLVDNLPSITTVVNMYVQLIIGQGLETNGRNNQAKLDEWLKYRVRPNITNQDVITEAIENSVTYGYGGLRLIENNIYPVLPSNFYIWKMPLTINGEVVPMAHTEMLYEVVAKAVPIEKDGHQAEELTVDGVRYTLAEAVKQNKLHQAVDGSFYLGEKKDVDKVEQVFVPSANFCHLRHNLKGDYGVSPLSRDKLRLGLMIDVLKNMTDDVNNDGNDYVMWLKATSTAGSSISSMLSPNAAANIVAGASDNKATGAGEEKRGAIARALAKAMKRSDKTRVIVANKNYIEDVSRLDGTVKLVDYFPYVEQATTIVANALGLHPILAGSTSSGWNTSMGSVIQFTLEKIIVPFQRKYSSQLEPYIQKATGIKEPIKFKEYDLADQESRAKIEKIIAETQKLLAESAKIVKETQFVGKQAKVKNKSTEEEK